MNRVTRCRNFLLLKARSEAHPHLHPPPDDGACTEKEKKEEIKNGCCEIAPGGRCPYLSGETGRVGRWHDRWEGMIGCVELSLLDGKRGL